MRRLLALALLPVVLAACGGSSTAKGTTTTPRQSAAEFVRAGNQVCIASDKRIFKIGRLSRDPKGWKRTADSARLAVTDMRALTPPADRVAAFGQMMKYANALALTIQEIHASLVKNDVSTAAAGQLAAGQLQDKVHQAARRAGLTFCQQALTNWPA